MPLKRSSLIQTLLSQKKVEQTYSKDQTLELAKDLASVLNPGDRVLLEGPMGSGKSTFSKMLLENLNLKQRAQGSPSFSIVHEYEIEDSKVGVAHLDFYRLKHEQEIEEAGIPDYFWDNNFIVLSEWTSLFETFEKQVLENSPLHRNWKMFFDFTDDLNDSQRKIALEINF